LLARVKARFAQQGSEVEFDDATGAIRLGSDILFEEGSAKLTRRGQETLKTTMPLYFEALLGDPRLGDYVDRISIEGHTNSNYSGSANPRDAYLYNLRLSQGRAYAALDYIIRHQLGGARDVKEVLVANGYSHSRIILNPESGQEDKARSRRIEIRFRLKDEETLRVLEGVLRRGVDTDNSIQVPQ
jgi:chemotaxis protein MotB